MNGVALSDAGRVCRFLPSEGVTAILACGAINRSVGRPLAESGAPLSLGGLCRCAWELSNLLELDSVHPIE